MAIVRVPVRLEYPQQGGPGFNIFHISTAGIVPNSNLSEALDALEAFYSGLTDFLNGPGKIVIGEGMISDPLGAPEYVDDDVREITTAGSVAASPSLLAIVCGWRTSSATRQGRGRTFVGPWGIPSLQSDGTPTTAVLNTLRTQAQTLVDDSRSANGWALGVLSTTSGVFRDVTGVTVRDRFAVLRSRRD